MEEVKEIITSFRKKRDWNKYDSEGNLAKSIIIEAAELLEHFQWNENDYNRIFVVSDIHGYYNLFEKLLRIHYN